MSNELKAGDNVILKSDGPTMTIDHLEGTKIAVCVWFKNNLFNREKISVDALKKV